MLHPRPTELATHLALACLAVALFGYLYAATGRIAVANGQGFDGPNYVNMLVGRLDAGTANTMLRPSVILVNRQLLRLVDNPLQVFKWMNVFYTAVLGFALSLLFARYNVNVAARLLFIANVFLCIATAKMFAYYPALIDLGAYTMVTLAVCAIVVGWRVPAAGLCVAAALSREFAVAVVLFGVHRDLRRRVAWWKIVATYAPALIVYAWWRGVVSQRFPPVPVPQFFTASQLLHNLHFWTDPRFVAVFLYFFLTLFGGVSVLVFARARDAVGLLRREHEWATLSMAITAAAAVGDADIWRYLAYMLPAFTVLFAWCARSLNLPGGNVALAALITITTLLTQRPWQTIDDIHYFRDWFPYYQVNAPDVRIRLLWGFRCVSAVWLLLLMWAVARRPARASLPAGPDAGPE